MADPAPGYLDKVADAIYWAEGGSKTKHPYGLVNYNRTNEDYRGICLYHLAKYHAKWETAGTPGEFLSYLGSYWAPVSSHELNTNWLKNVSYFMRHPKPTP